MEKEINKKCDPLKCSTALSFEIQHLKREKELLEDINFYKKELYKLQEKKIKNEKCNKCIQKQIDIKELEKELLENKKNYFKREIKYLDEIKNLKLNND